MGSFILFKNKKKILTLFPNNCVEDGVGYQLCVYHVEDFKNMKSKNICKWYNIYPMKRYFKEV